MTSFIAACGSGRSTSFIPAVPAAWSVTTIAFIVHLLVCGMSSSSMEASAGKWRYRQRTTALETFDRGPVRPEAVVAVSPSSTAVLAANRCALLQYDPPGFESAGRDVGNPSVDQYSHTRDEASLSGLTQRRNNESSPYQT